MTGNREETCPVQGCTCLATQFPTPRETAAQARLREIKRRVRELMAGHATDTRERRVALHELRCQWRFWRAALNEAQQQRMKALGHIDP